VLRKRAIRSLLVEQVAGLRPATSHSPDDASSEEQTAGGPSPGGASSAPAPAGHRPSQDRRDREELEAQLEALQQAERRAKLVVALDWLALAVLFVFRDTAAPFLPFDGTIETIFTLGVLAVAIHSGFRLGQLEKYRAVLRVHEEIR
jgi:hypothetical protein